MSKVKDVSTQIRGVSYKPTDLHDTLDNDSILLLRANNIENDKLNFDNIVYVDKSKVGDLQYLRVGDILICASSGSKNLVGKAAIIKKDLTATFGAFCKVVRPKDILPNFLGYYFSSSKYRNTISQLSAGANINNIRNEHIDSLDITIPSLEIQHQIAKNLDKVTHLIDLCNAILEKLDLLVKARFMEMFGDIETNNYKLKTEKLGDVAFVGSSHRVFTSEFVEKGIPFYRGTEIGELAKGHYPKDPYYISEEHYNRIANDETKPKYGDLLMPSICNKGQIWMVDTDEPFYYKDGRVLCISARRDIYNTRYLQHFLKKKTEAEYDKIGSGSTFAEFKIFQLKNFDILTPPLELQTQFAVYVTQAETAKSKVTQLREKAETLKKALMQEYFG